MNDGRYCCHQVKKVQSDAKRDRRHELEEFTLGSCITSIAIANAGLKGPTQWDKVTTTIAFVPA